MRTPIGTRVAALLAALPLAGCGGGSRSPGSPSGPGLPRGADAAVAARSLALDRAALQGRGAELAGFYTTDYTDDQGLTRTTRLQATQAFLDQFTVVSQLERRSVLRDTLTHVVENWSDTLAVKDKTAGNAALSLDEGEIDAWRRDGGVWRIDHSQALPTAGVQQQRPPARGRFR